jgi:hypothetical protein
MPQPKSYQCPIGKFPKENGALLAILAKLVQK